MLHAAITLLLLSMLLLMPSVFIIVSFLNVVLSKPEIWSHWDSEIKMKRGGCHRGNVEQSYIVKRRNLYFMDSYCPYW